MIESAVMTDKIEQIAQEDYTNVDLQAEDYKELVQLIHSAISELDATLVIEGFSDDEVESIKHGSSRIIADGPINYYAALYTRLKSSLHILESALREAIIDEVKGGVSFEDAIQKFHINKTIAYNLNIKV